MNNEKLDILDFEHDVNRALFDLVAGRLKIVIFRSTNNEGLTREAKFGRYSDGTFFYEYNVQGFKKCDYNRIQPKGLK